MVIPFATASHHTREGGHDLGVLQTSGQLRVTHDNLHDHLLHAAPVPALAAHTGHAARHTTGHTTGHSTGEPAAAAASGPSLLGLRLVPVLLLLTGLGDLLSLLLDLLPEDLLVSDALLDLGGL
jgi:hypothetical protein